MKNLLYHYGISGQMQLFNMTDWFDEVAHPITMIFYIIN